MTAERTDTFTFADDLSPEEWRALPRAFKKGEQVLRFKGHDYGCTSDDARFGAVESIACCENPDGPFFTVPTSFLRLPNGEPPRGAYAVRATEALMERGLKLP